MRVNLQSNQLFEGGIIRGLRSLPLLLTSPCSDLIASAMSGYDETMKLTAPDYVILIVEDLDRATGAGPRPAGIESRSVLSVLSELYSQLLRF